MKKLTPNLDTIGGRVKYLREGIGLTREEFGELVGIKVRRLIMFETGERRIGEADISAICKALPWTAHWVTYGGPIEKSPGMLNATLSDITPKAAKNGYHKDQAK